MSTPYNCLSGRSAERLRTRADGVFAIAMTLLVLDLRLPEADDVGNHEAATSTVTPGDLRRLR